MSASVTSSKKPPYGRSVECRATAPPGSTRTRPPKPEVSPLPLTPKAPLRKPPLGVPAPISGSVPLRSPGPVMRPPRWRSSASCPPVLCPWTTSRARSSPGLSEPGRPLVGQQDRIATALLDGELAGTALGGGLLVGAAQLLVGAHGRGHLDVQVGSGAVLAGLLELGGPLRTERLVLDLVVQLEDRVHQHLRARRTARQVHVHRHDVVDALDDRVVVEHAAGAGAHAHGQHPP